MLLPMQTWHNLATTRGVGEGQGEGAELDAGVEGAAATFSGLLAM